MKIKRKIKIVERIKKHLDKKKELKEEYQIMKEDFLYNKTKLIKINDLIDKNRRGEKNAVTTLREIRYIVKGF